MTERELPQKRKVWSNYPEVMIVETGLIAMKEQFGLSIVEK